MVVSKDFEERVAKMIWGTRLPGQEDYYTQVNVKTLVEKLSKNPRAKELLPVWEYLCEATHPNVIGNIRFWSHVETTHQDGSELRVLSRYAEGDTALHLLEKAIWGLSWSAVCVRNGFEITKNGLHVLLKKIGVQPPGGYIA